jgi:hypothetical protein
MNDLRVAARSGVSSLVAGAENGEELKRGFGFSCEGDDGEGADGAAGLPALVSSLNSFGSKV